MGQTEEIKVPEASRIVEKSLKLMKYIANNRDQVFSEKAQIFPAHFTTPQISDDRKNNIKQLGMDIENWTKNLWKVKENITKINKLYLDSEQSKPDNEQFQELQRALDDFSKSTTLFRQTYEEEIQVELARRYYNIDDTLAIQGVIPKDQAPHSAPLIGLGHVASACWNKHKEIFEILSEIENIWSLM